MAYPTIAGYTTGSRTSNATSTSITVPSGTQAGDLMLLLISKDGTGLFTAPSGWEVLENTGSSAQAVGVFYRQLTAPLSNFTIAHASEMTAWVLLRIPDGEVPQKSSRATGSSTSPNPPSLTHSFGAGTEVMWLAMMGHDYNRTTSAYPSNFPDNRINSRSTATGGSGVSMATLNSTTNPQDPGTFTISSRDTWQAYTLAIKTRPTTTTIELASILESSVETLSNLEVIKIIQMAGILESGIESTADLMIQKAVYLQSIIEIATETQQKIEVIKQLQSVSEIATEFENTLQKITALASTSEVSIETAVDLGKVLATTLMRIDSLLNLAVLGEIVEGAVVNLDKYGTLTVTEIIEGNEFSLSPTGVLTVNTFREEGI